MHVEDGEYLLQEKVSTLGVDSLGSARAWLFGRFYTAGNTTIFAAFIESTFTDLASTDLDDLETIRAAYLTNTGDAETTSIYMMLFESLIRLTIAYFWQASRMDSDAEVEEKTAQELISTIVGSLADPDTVIGGELTAGIPSVTVDIMTDAEIKSYLGNFE